MQQIEDTIEARWRRESTTSMVRPRPGRRLYDTGVYRLSGVDAFKAEVELALSDLKKGTARFKIYARPRFGGSLRFSRTLEPRGLTAVDLPLRELTIEFMKSVPVQGAPPDFSFDIVTAKVRGNESQTQQDNSAVLYMIENLVRKIGRSLGYLLIQRDQNANTIGLANIVSPVNFAPAILVSAGAASATGGIEQNAALTVEDLSVEWSE